MANVNGSCEHLKKLIREVPDFPKKGILFYDITTLLNTLRIKRTPFILLRIFLSFASAGVP